MMRYRKLTDSGDYSFGHSRNDFLVDTPAAVAQAILTRLKLFTGEWFLDTTEGTPWYTQVLGKGTESTRDLAMRERILNTQGVIRIDAYASSYDASARRFSVQATVTTQFGAAAFSLTVTPNLVGSTNFEISGYGEGGYGRTGYGN